MRRTCLVLLVGLVGVTPSAASGEGQFRPAAAPRPRAAQARSRLVFAATIVQGQEQVYSVEPSGRAPAQLTFGTEPSSGPLPSPNGSYVVFSRAGSLWMMRPDGRGQRLLAARGIRPAWTPDSGRIAYVSVTAQNEPLGLRVVGVDGKHDRMLVPGADSSAASWSPDGRSLAFARGGSLFVLRAGAQHRVVARPGIYIDRVLWSSDGRWLALDYDNPTQGSGLEVVRANGRSGRDLHGVRSGTAIWSPKRTLLAFVGYGSDPSHSSFESLNPTTGGTKRLAPATSYINSLAWAPDGASLAFSGGTYLSEDLTANSSLGVVTLAGRVRLLDRGGSYPLPESVAWATEPRGLRYRRPVTAGPLVSKDELAFRVPVDELAADGKRVAYRSCGTIGVWQPGAATIGGAQTDSPLCGEGNISFYNLALAGDQIAWGVIRGGIGRSNTLAVETLGSPGRQAVVAVHSQIAGDPRGDERTGDLLGAGQLLVFSTWAYCDEVIPATCPNLPYGQATKIGAQTLWRVREPSWPDDCPSGNFVQTTGHCQQLRAERGPLRPLDVDASRIVVSGDNETLVLDPDGKELLSIPVSTTAAQISASDLIVLVPGALRDYDAATGALLRTWPLPDVSFGGVCHVPQSNCDTTRLRLVGAARGLAAYLLDGKLHLLRLRDGADTNLTDATAAQLTDAGLFYAYRANGTWTGRIRFVPFNDLPLQ